MMDDSSEVDLKTSLLKAGFSEEELEREIERKKEEYKEFISEQGILFLIAKEQGLNIRSPNIDPVVYDLIEEEDIDYDEFKINISEVEEGMTNIVLLGRVGLINKTNFFMRNDSSTGKVSSFLLKDNSGVIKIVLWGENVDLMENEVFEFNHVVRILGGYSKINNDHLEVHLGRKARLMLLSAEEEKAHGIPPLEEELELNALSSNQKISLAEILEKKTFIPRLEGFVRIVELKEFEKQEGEKSFLLKFILSQEIDEVMVNAWGLKAIEVLKVLEDGCKVSITSLVLRKDPYSHEKELHFTKKSILERF